MEYGMDHQKDGWINYIRVVCTATLISTRCNEIITLTLTTTIREHAVCEMWANTDTCVACVQGPDA